MNGKGKKKWPDGKVYDGFYQEDTLENIRYLK